MSRESVFERHPKKTLGAIVVVLFLLIDFGTAAVLKMLDLFTPAYQMTYERESKYRQSHPVYHHTLKPNAYADNAEWGGDEYEVYTNSLGFKDGVNRTIELKPKTKRLVLIGDSFTEGVGIEYPQTFAGLIDAYFRDKDTEVLNAAVLSYSPIIYYKKIQYLLETVGLEFDHLVVFMDISDIDNEANFYVFDENNNVKTRDDGLMFAWDRPKESKPIRNFFNNHTFFIARIRTLLRIYRGKKRSWDDGLNFEGALWTVDEKAYNSYGEQGVQLAQQRMDMLKTLLDEHQIKLTLVVYPWPDQIFRRDLNSRQVTVWQDWCRTNQVPFIDLFPDFINESDPETTIRRFFITGDVHWNAAGHQRIADGFLQRFTQVQ